MMDIFIQAIGIVAMIISLVAVQFKFRKHILATHIISSVLWLAHFLLLGAITGAMMNVVGVVRLYVFSRWRVRKIAQY